jgi:hypothetical protein
MATWKKVIVSGSKADLNEVTASTAKIATATISAGTITGITDLVVADGGTGASSLTDGGVLLGSGTGAITAMSVLADGEMIVGDGSTDPVAESGATLRASIGVDTAVSGAFVSQTILSGSGTLFSGSVASTGSVGHLFVADDALVTDRLYFKDFGGEYISGDGTDLTLTSGADINIPSNIGLTFGDDGEKIEGNGTRLSIASGTGMVLDCEGDIELNADGGDVDIKDNTVALLNINSTKVSGSATSTGSFGFLNVADAGLMKNRLYFSDIGGEYISGDGTDLTLTSANDINIPTDVGLTFGNDGEKIEGNGTRLSIASGTGLVLDGEGDIEINADGGNVNIKDNTAALLDISATKVSGSITSTGSFGALTVTDGVTATLSPIASDGAALGTTSNQWSDLHLAEGGVINWDNSDFTATQVSNLLTLTGGNTRVDKLEIDSANDHIDVSTDLVLTANADITLTAGGGNIKPGSNDQSALGVSGTGFSDLFLASGGVVNFDAGDVTMTHSSNKLTVAGGTLEVTGDLTVTGTTTTLKSTNLIISDQYAFFASGSSATNIDAGILVQSGSVAGSGSAFYHDISAGRWAVAVSVAEGDTKALTSAGLVVTATTGTADPVTTVPTYGVGEVYVDTNDGNEGGFWIYT